MNQHEPMIFSKWLLSNATKEQKIAWLLSCAIKSPTGCLEWAGGFHTVGYGSISRYVDKSGLAHRAMYVLTFGEIPDEMHVCHKCDNRKCINPEHFFLGSLQENLADMVKKGRNRGGYLNNIINDSSRAIRARAETIRAWAKMGWSGVEMCRAFKISETHYYRILRNKACA